MSALHTPEDPICIRALRADFCLGTVHFSIIDAATSALRFLGDNKGGRKRCMHRLPLSTGPDAPHDSEPGHAHPRA